MSSTSVPQPASTPAATTASGIPSSWDLPQNVSVMFPKGDTNRLAGEDGYLVWALRMQNAFEYCGLLDIVDGKITRPSPGDATEAVWLKMNHQEKPPQHYEAF